MREGYIDAIFGLQKGDEGKGRFAHHLAAEHDVVARFNGGANAGHVFYWNGQKVGTHQIPSGIAHEGVVNLITNGCLVDPVAFQSEHDDLREKGIPVSEDKLRISNRAALILPHHILLDTLDEAGTSGEGSTKKGIKYGASAKYRRVAVDLSDFVHRHSDVMELVIESVATANQSLKDQISTTSDPVQKEELRKLLESPEKHWVRWRNAAELLLGFSTDTVAEVRERLFDGQSILAEGAQGYGLDVHHGFKGQTSSSHCDIGGVLSSFGVGDEWVRDKFGVAKLTQSRVGGTAESFPTIIDDEEIAARLRLERGQPGAEYGETTSRPRSMGWLDLEEIRNGIIGNGIKKLLLTKLDCVPLAGDITMVATHYEDGYGKRVKKMPTSADDLRDAFPVYETLETWPEDISGVRSYQELPENAKRFLDFIREELDIEIVMVGVGTETEQFIDMRNVA